MGQSHAIQTASAPPAALPEGLAAYRLLTSDEAALLLGVPVATLRVTGAETFRALTRLQESRRAAHELLGSVDALLTPTVTETFSIVEMLADPIRLHARLGLFTTFTNLLDLCAVAVPAGGSLVFGVTVQAAAGNDAFLVGLADALERIPARDSGSSCRLSGRGRRERPTAAKRRDANPARAAAC